MKIKTLNPSKQYTYQLHTFSKLISYNKLRSSKVLVSNVKYYENSSPVKLKNRSSLS